MKRSLAGDGGSGSRLVREVYPRATPLLDGEVTPAQITALATSLRAAADKSLPVARVAMALGATCERWRDRDYAPRRETVGAIAAAWGWSEALLDESIDALMAPMSRTALDHLAGQLPRRSNLIGLILPGNIPGAGIHEFTTALLAGCALMIKTATAESFFFARFTQTLRESDSEVGARIAVLNWSRERTVITSSLRTNCDWIAAFGDDDTLAQLEAKDLAAPGTGGGGMLKACFGSRVSGAIVTAEVVGTPAAAGIADALARDVSLFEQQGCLSPHHVFVESTDPGIAAAFARELAAALARFALRMPPSRRYGLEDAAAVRRVRESARWRALGGRAVSLMEGDDLGWTVVCDDQASFTISPGFRTVTVSPIANLEELKGRLTPVAGHLEAFAIAASTARREALRTALAAMGICYLCEPGAMQSPPLDWTHGGGVFMHALTTSR